VYETTNDDEYINSIAKDAHAQGLSEGLTEALTIVDALNDLLGTSLTEKNRKEIQKWLKKTATNLRKKIK
jgi:glutaredoxin 2